VEAWKPVTRAVHDAGGRIVMQLWHVGRISHPSLLDGRLPWAPSAIAPAGHVSLIRPETAYVVPHAMSVAEIAEVIAQFRQGAANAQAAGFDGVELHGANGYLLDQFLQDGSNTRDDDYGGSIANRARLLLDCTDAAISVWGAGRVGVHLSPRGDATASRPSVMSRGNSVSEGSPSSARVNTRAKGASARSSRRPSAAPGSRTRSSIWTAATR
jgi:2,4-dienoyl-CoA reductase-like NADH-dependent reductase (Old Yellow Enzyme family)